MKKTCSIVFSIAILSFLFYIPSQIVADEITYEITGKNASLQREVTGMEMDDVDGVPASPVDSFVYDGIGSVPIEGAKVTIEVDPVANTGEIKAKWTDENGVWKFAQTAFAPPDHPNGLRIGSDADAAPELETGDSIATNVYLHGNTTAGGPVLPTVFNLLITWGTAEVTLNGNPFDNPYDGPAPLWAAHTMTTVGARGDDGTVRTTGDNIYSFPPPVDAADGAVDSNDLEVHLVFHDAPGPMVMGNVPPPFSFFYHLTFEDVEVRIEHEE